jgi:hypothetical protein
MATQQTGVRQGRISLKVGYGPLPGRAKSGPRYQSFLVRQEADGSIYYRLGTAARTSDGWVALAPEHHAAVAWDN